MAWKEGRTALRQGSSDFPDFAAFLVAEGIDSISVTPDSVLKTLRTLSAMKEEALVS
jgi:pyruvate, water dikinase